jgi:hypothetical protein
MLRERLLRCTELAGRVNEALDLVAPRIRGDPLSAQPRQFRSGSPRLALHPNPPLGSCHAFGRYCPYSVKAQSVVTRNVVSSGGRTARSPCGVPGGAQSYGTGCAR